MKLPKDLFVGCNYKHQSSKYVPNHDSLKSARKWHDFKLEILEFYEKNVRVTLLCIISVSQGAPGFDIDNELSICRIARQCFGCDVFSPNLSVP